MIGVRRKQSAGRPRSRSARPFERESRKGRESARGLGMGGKPKRFGSLAGALCGVLALALSLSGCGKTFVPTGGSMGPSAWAKFVAAKGLSPEAIPNPVAVTDELKRAATSMGGV